MERSLARSMETPESRHASAACFGMVLVGALSNPDLQDLFQSLTSQPRRKQPETATAGYGPASDGRRKFGSVSGAIVHVLREAQSDLRLREINAEVEQLLGEPVSRQSIKGCLHRGSQAANPQFERISRGRYRLARQRGGIRDP
jgi:hypothetical protein